MQGFTDGSPTQNVSCEEFTAAPSLLQAKASLDLLSYRFYFFRQFNRTSVHVAPGSNTLQQYR